MEQQQKQSVQETSKEETKAERSPEQIKADAARWTLVSRLSSKLPGSQQDAQPGRSSGHSTPSNLERAVLLLEAEAESVSGNSNASAAQSIVNSPDKPAGDSESEAAAAEEGGGTASADRLGGSSAADGSSRKEKAVKEQGRSAKTVSKTAKSTEDLEAQRAALRKLNISDDSEPSKQGGESLDEGPSTPPASSAAAHADTKASSSPNSTAGEQLTRPQARPFMLVLGLSPWGRVPPADMHPRALLPAVKKASCKVGREPP